MNIKDGSKFREDQQLTCDALIIGSGAGGAVLAKELAQGGQSVIIIEEGDQHPSSSHRDLPFQAVQRLYRDKGFTTTLGTPSIPLPMGRVWGGTTLINSGTCFRTPEHIFNHWQKTFGLTDLNPQRFDPYFERVERNLHVAPADFGVMGKSNLLFHEFLQKNWPAGKPLLRNTKYCDGRGFCCYGCPTGAKQSMEQNYLPQAIKLGAKGFVNTKLERLITRNKKIVGALANFLDKNGRPTGHQITVLSKNTFLCTGSLMTPAILKKNKIASRNKHVGKHLSLHPATKVYAQFAEDIFGWEGTPQAYYSDVFNQDGVTFEGIFVPPDIVALTAPFVGNKFVEFMNHYRKIASFGFLIEDSSEGSIYNLPLLGPTILYDINKADVEKFKKGVLFLAQLFLRGGAEKVFTLLHGHTEITSEEDLKKLEHAKIKNSDIESMAFHPLGSCRMGMSAARAVVGPDFKVFGHENLYICDGSVIPSSLGVNPQISIMAFATALAEQILGRLS